MKMSTSVELVWQLAMREAVNAGFAEVMPEHFMEAVLKLADLPIDKLKLKNGEQHAAVRLAGEITSLRKKLAELEIDSTKTRQGVRTSLGHGGVPHEGGQLHRSKASRALFMAAADIASRRGADTLKAKHLLSALLSSPSDHMIDALKGTVSVDEKPEQNSPQLKEYGDDLTCRAREGNLPVISGRVAERNALLRALTSTEGKNVVLVGSDDDAVRDVILSAIGAVAAGQRVDDKELRGTRFIDLAAIGTNDLSDENALAPWGALFDEAAGAGDTILILPAIEPENSEAWLKMLEQELARDGVRCICRVTPDIFEQEMARSSSWRALAASISVQDTEIGEIPVEL